MRGQAAAISVPGTARRDSALNDGSGGFCTLQRFAPYDDATMLESIDQNHYRLLVAQTAFKNSGPAAERTIRDPLTVARR